MAAPSSERGECRHCGHDWCYHRYGQYDVDACHAMGLRWVDAGCSGLFVRRRGLKRQPFDSGFGCDCPYFEPLENKAAIS